MTLTHRPVPPPKPVPLAMPAVEPWRWVFRSTFALMLILGFLVGFVAGSQKPRPVAKSVAVLAARPANVESIPAAELKPDPKLKPVEAKSPEAKPPEPEPPEPKTKPEPKPKNLEPEPKPEPKKAPPAKPVGEVTFARLAPVFKDKCGVCHGGANAKGNLDLRSAKTTIAGGENGEAVKPGDPDNSLLWQRIVDKEMPMPPKDKPKLTEDDKKLIKEWIAGGAK